MPNSINVKNSTSVSILLHEQVSIGMSVLLRDVFTRANYLAGAAKIHIQFVSTDARKISVGGLEFSTKRCSPSTDILIVPPFNIDFQFNLKPFTKEIALIKKVKPSETRIASVCLGALLVAASSILDGKEATTHWRALDYTRVHFPLVKWNLKKILCDSGQIITSGGYLAGIDLALYLVAKIYSKKISQNLGQYILSDSIRQKQSIYAQNLVSTQEKGSGFYQLEQWIQKNIHRPIAIAEMAQEKGMSLRSFHRHFTESFGIPPNKYLQLKRIEKAQSFLKENRLSLEQIVDLVGLSDVSSFREIFFREIGMSPAEFRRRFK